jgi:TPR repeat protein
MTHRNTYHHPFKVILMKIPSILISIVIGLATFNGLAANSLSRAPLQDVAYFADGAWLRHQAELGDPRFQFTLGNKYFTSDPGLKIVQDYDQAEFWYRRAARQGYADAAYNLAVMNVQGIGNDIDLVEGLAWLEVASGFGHRLSAELAAELRDIMSDERGREADELKEKLVPGYARLASKD